MSDLEARTVAAMLADPGLPPEFRAPLVRDLFDYFKTLLTGADIKQIPTPRRWMQ